MVANQKKHDLVLFNAPKKFLEKNLWKNLLEKSAGKIFRHALVKAAPRARLHEAGKDRGHRAVVQTLAAIGHKARVGEALGQVFHRLGLARAGRSRRRAAHVKRERLRESGRRTGSQSNQAEYMRGRNTLASTVFAGNAALDPRFF